MVKKAAKNEFQYQPSVLRSAVLQSVQWLVVRIGVILEFFGFRPWSHFDIASMKKEATAMSGEENLTDFGDDDLQPALQHTLGSLRKDKDLSLFGRWFMHHHWVENVLHERLKLVKYWKRNPQYVNVPVRKPLFVVGYPRSGTTFMHYLLAQDPLAYSPPLWQSTTPTPPPSHNPDDADPRIYRCYEEMKLYFDIAPLIRAMHPVDIHLPHECFHFFDRTYLDSQWSVRCQGESSYFEWWEGLDYKDVLAYYKDYKRQMQLLALNHPRFTQENPTHFIMKDPQVHSYFLGALIETFPDANIVEVHRHPGDSLHSYLLLESTVADLFYEPYDRRAYGARMFETFRKRRRVMDAHREEKLGKDSDQYVDVTYKEFLKDPIATVRNLYKHFGYTYTQEFEENMKIYIEKNKNYKLGDYRHLLSWEPYGLSREMVEEELKDYIEKFDL